MSDLTNNENNLTPYQFPHLDDTQFPLLENIDVYKYENNFDYERWKDDTKIVLCNVLFNSDYKDVVKFENDAARDEYFNNIDGYTVYLKTRFHVTPENEVAVPLPYQVATRYNYLYVDLPIMTSDEEPINYEDTRRTQRFYYFIDGVIQKSPSATALIVKLDAWTTYINNVDIPYMMLERGHAPMKSVDVDTYLQDPINNNSLLLAPDYDFGENKGVIKEAKFVPINNGKKYILIATSMSVSQLQALQYPLTTDGKSTPATYEWLLNSDGMPSRNGEDYKVNDYEWNLGIYDYTNIYTQTTPYQSSDGSIPNNFTMLAVESTNAEKLMTYMSEVVPFVYRTIKACFMVSENMLKLSAPFTFCNTTCYIAQAADDNILHTIQLVKEDFNYPEKYANITKLYTSPYASLEITDNNGESKTIKIENTSSMNVRLANSIAFPFIRMQAYLTGINGSGYEEYSWQQLNGNVDTMKMWDDDFGDYLWNWDIPTYALFVKGYNSYVIDNAIKQKKNRYNAIVDYHQSIAPTNNTELCTIQAADNTQTMTNNSANTEQGNANRSATRQYGNSEDDNFNGISYRSAATANTNAIASSNTAHTNTYNQANAQIQNNNDSTEKMVADFESGQRFSNNTSGSTYVANKIAEFNKNVDNQLISAMLDSNVEYQNITGIANATTQMINGVGNGMSQLGSLNFSGAIGSVVSGAANAANTGISTWAGINKLEAQALAQVQANNSKLAGTQTNNLANWQLTWQGGNLNDQLTTHGTQTMNKITKTTTDMMKTNADNTNNTNIANANRTKATSNKNADIEKQLMKDNAKDTKDNSVTNAKLNRDTNVSIAGHNRFENKRVAQRELERKRINNQFEYQQGALNAPTSYGASSGDMTLDAFQRRGLQIKVRTQSDGNIAQAGDLMLRYGYSLNQVWQNCNLNVMEYFTYWKVSDIWINGGEGVNQSAQKDIQTAFENGVTVWSDPKKIGKVSIYDN